MGGGQISLTSFEIGDFIHDGCASSPESTPLICSGPDDQSPTYVTSRPGDNFYIGKGRAKRVSLLVRGAGGRDKCRGAGFEKLASSLRRLIRPLRCQTTGRASIHTDKHWRKLRGSC